MQGIELAKTELLSFLRALLVLGRVSNLPTVWSNCLAGWLLSGGGYDWGKFALLCLGATLLYLGGMFLNDACDYFYDVQYRRERPIPSGTIDLVTVWCYGIGWLAIGTMVLVFLGQSTAILAVLLLICIVAYDITHKWISYGPVIMAACRFFLYLLAGSTAAEGVSGLTIWSALALAAYVVGLSYLARRESSKGPLYAWPAYLLLIPVLLALIANSGGYRLGASVLSALLILWILWCLRYTFWNPKRDVGRTVSGLLAGIVLVDWLAVAGSGWGLSVVFLVLFATALFFQRFIPAT